MASIANPCREFRADEPDQRCRGMLAVGQHHHRVEHECVERQLGDRHPARLVTDRADEAADSRVADFKHQIGQDRATDRETAGPGPAHHELRDVGPGQRLLGADPDDREAIPLMRHNIAEDTPSLLRATNRCYIQVAEGAPCGSHDPRFVPSSPFPPTSGNTGPVLPPPLTCRGGKPGNAARIIVFCRNSGRQFRPVNPAELAATLGKARRVGREWQCLCPAHNDHDPSLSIIEKGGKLLFTCRAGCSNEAVIEQLKSRGLWEKPEQHNRIVATYPYQDESGKLLFEVVRYEPKKFLQRRPDGAGGWNWKLGDTRRVLYHLSELIAAKGTGNGQGWRVYICEGEKDADRLRKQWGVTATSNPGGAGKWRHEYNQHFIGADAVIIADNDKPGRDHANQVAAQLRSVATNVRILHVRGKQGDDISTWLDEGLGQSDLEDLIRELPPPTPESGGLRIYDFDEIDYDPDSDVWLIEDLFLTEEISLIFGGPNVGKTFFALNASLAVADINADTWFGRKIAHGNVVYIASEGGKRINKRIVAWKSHHLYDRTTKLPFWLVREPIDLCHGEADLQNIIVAIRSKIGNRSLILLTIETVNSALAGGDENSPVDMGKLIANIRVLRDEFKCHVILIHHPPRAQVTARGHSSLPAAVETELFLSKDEESGVTTVKMTKQRESEVSPPFAFRLKVIQLGENRDGKSVSSCVVESV